MKKVAAHTLGCKVNMYDTEAMLSLFVENGYEIVDFSAVADIYLINTCTVTNVGDKKSRQMVSRARSANPLGIVVVCGCYAQVSPDEVSSILGVDLVLGTKERALVVFEVENYLKMKANGEIPKNGKAVCKTKDLIEETRFEHLSVSGMSEKTRAYLKIQDGCDRFCSYCIIPYARGPVRSRKPADVLKQVEMFALKGVKEIVLAGIHVASYGKDLADENLLSLIKKIHEINGIERIRFSSLEPLLIDDYFVSEIKKLNKICAHFHLSLQSGCDKTLKNMNRKYNVKQFETASNLLKSAFPGVALTTDIIVGFPLETEADFLESYEFAKKIGFAKIHVFPFSSKKGTKAALMSGQVNSSVKSKRAKELISLSEKMANEFLMSLVCKNVSVLYEKSLGKNLYEGHSAEYVRVQTYSENDLVNKIRTVTISDTSDDLAISLPL